MLVWQAEQVASVEVLNPTITPSLINVEVEPAQVERPYPSEEEISAGYLELQKNNLMTSMQE